MTHMPYRLNIDTAVNTAFVQFYGEYVREDGIDASRQILANPAHVPGLNFLKDYSAIRVPKDYDFCFAAPAQSRHAQVYAHVPHFRNTLVAAKSAVFGRLRQYCMLSESGPVDNQAFQSLSEATAWLGLPAGYVINSGDYARL
jgi:hypothetical protein